MTCSARVPFQFQSNPKCFGIFNLRDFSFHFLSFYYIFDLSFQFLIDICCQFLFESNLSTGLKGMPEQQVDTSLEQVVTIFRFLQDKDIFENFYKQHLAKRLLMGRSLSDEAERAMISKLKSECGHLYTSKLEGMFSDMKLSEEVMKDYRTAGSAANGSYSRGASGSSAPPAGLELKVTSLFFWMFCFSLCALRQSLPTMLY